MWSVVVVWTNSCLLGRFGSYSELEKAYVKVSACGFAIVYTNQHAEYLG